MNQIINDIKVAEIYRVYKEDNDLVILYVQGHETRIRTNSEEEREMLIEQLQEKGHKELYDWRVYNGLDEAKGDR